MKGGDDTGTSKSTESISSRKMAVDIYFYYIESNREKASRRRWNRVSRRSSRDRYWAFFETQSLISVIESNLFYMLACSKGGRYPNRTGKGRA